MTSSPEAVAHIPEFFRLIWVARNVPGLDTAIRQVNQLGLPAVQGLYHVLDDIVARGVDMVQHLEVPFRRLVDGVQQERVIDVVFKDGRLVEYKNFIDCGKRNAERLLSPFRGYLQIFIEDEVRMLKYRFRGARTPACAALVEKMLAAVRGVSRDLVSRFTRQSVEFLGKTVPF